jgi:hypothetical protein
MAATYEPIASTTLGSAAASYTFSSIPGTFRDLVVKFAGTTTGGYSLALQFNGDTGTNYSNTRLGGYPSGAYSTRETSAAYILNSGNPTSNQSTQVTQIMSYANTSVYKTTLCQSAVGAEHVARIVGLWRSTSAITSVTIYPLGGSDTMASGSVISLFGIKAA